MTKFGIHPMVILWSSYGDPMVRVLLGVVNGVVLGRKRRCRVCGRLGMDIQKKFKENARGHKKKKKKL